MIRLKQSIDYMRLVFTLFESSKGKCFVKEKPCYPMCLARLPF